MILFTLQCSQAEARRPSLLCKHTNEAKDVADGGHKDNEQVHQEEETKCNADVYDPAESLVREQDLEQSPADLQREGRKELGCCAFLNKIAIIVSKQNLL